jgi:hypothetical protein
MTPAVSTSGGIEKALLPARIGGLDDPAIANGHQNENISPRMPDVGCVLSTSVAAFLRRR